VRETISQGVAVFRSLQPQVQLVCQIIWKKGSEFGSYSSIYADAVYQRCGKELEKLPLETLL